MEERAHSRGQVASPADNSPAKGTGRLAAKQDFGMSPRWIGFKEVKQTKKIGSVHKQDQSDSEGASCTRTLTEFEDGARHHSAETAIQTARQTNQ